jgi:hypothetical protein
MSDNTTTVGGVPYVTSGWYEHEIDKRQLLHESTKGESTLDRYKDLEIVHSSDVYLSILKDSQPNVALSKNIDEVNAILLEMKDDAGFIRDIACPSCLQNIISVTAFSDMSVNLMKELINGIVQIARYNDITITDVTPFEDIMFPRNIITNKDSDRILEMEKELLPYLQLLEKVQKQFIDVSQEFLKK